MSTAVKKRAAKGRNMPARPERKVTRARRAETIKFLTLDETRRLFASIKDKRDKAIFLLAYRHGLRTSEVGLLRVSDLDFKRLRVMLHRLKGSLSGEHPLQADEARALKAWLKSREIDSPILFPSRRGLPISRQMLDVLMKGYTEEAAIPKDKQHFHVLKHSIATHLFRCRRRASLCAGLVRTLEHSEHCHLYCAGLDQPRDESAAVFSEIATLLIFSAAQDVDRGRK